jgi:mannitol/fructose-specific phosphotransferase system IIA component (Ntr-type)
MHPKINHLIQLQELSLIRAEQKAHRNGHRLDELDASIADLTSQLSPDVQALVVRMQKRDSIIIVPMANGTCTACGMRLPTSHVQQVKVSDQLQVCPICTRLLYFYEGLPRHVGKAPRRTEPRKVGVARFSSSALMIPRLKATTRDEAIRELATKMQVEGFVDDADKLVEAALKREAIVSTALDHSLAFPHVRGVEGGGLTLGLGISAKGIKFDGHDKSLTKIVFFLVIPTAASAFYLKLLAGLAETFADAEARKTLSAEELPEKLWKALIKLTKKTIT